MTRHVSPENITNLLTGEVFVFGSNHAGRHGKGAAKQAVKFGAITGQGQGLMGQTYGIPTKDRDLRVLSLYQIRCAVDRFLVFATQHPEHFFLVTPIGCGLAGYKPRDIAPMFSAVKGSSNVALPGVFWRVLDL